MNYFDIKKKVRVLYILMKLSISKKHLYPSIFNKMFDAIGMLSTLISIFLFFLKMILVDKNYIFWAGIILYTIIFCFLIKIFFQFLGYHDSISKRLNVSTKQGFRQSVKIFDKINFSKFYEKMFLSFLTVVLLFLNENALTTSISSNKICWVILTTLFLVFNVFLIFLAKNINLIKNSIKKYWTYSFLILNIFTLIGFLLFFLRIENFSFSAYILYCCYFAFLCVIVFFFVIYIMFIYNPPTKEK